MDVSKEDMEVVKVSKEDVSAGPDGRPVSSVATHKEQSREDLY